MSPATATWMRSPTGHSPNWTSPAMLLPRSIPRASPGWPTRNNCPFCPPGPSFGCEGNAQFQRQTCTFCPDGFRRSQRKAFVDEIWRLVQRYHMDGVDNDWEFPRTTDGTAESNLALMKDLARLCPGRGETIPAHDGRYLGTVPGQPFGCHFRRVDRAGGLLNVMVYGNFSETRPYQQHSPYSMLEASYDYWIVRRGMDPRKFVAGLPVYGLASGLPKRTSSASYATILRQNGPQAMVCDSARVVNSVHTTPYWVYYNGLPTIYRKVAFCVTKVWAGSCSGSEPGHDRRGFAGQGCLRCRPFRVEKQGRIISLFRR